MVVVSGRGQSGKARYGCPLKHARGICENGLHIRQDSLEREVLEGLQREVLSEDVVRYALAQFKQQLQERLASTKSQLTVLRMERELLKEEISNIAGVIATGRHSPALIAELEKRERRLDEISEELLASDGRGIHARLREIEDFVLSRLKDLNGLLTGEIPRAKAELAKHCTDITLTPEGKTYRLNGVWNWADVRMVPGARHAPRVRSNFKCLWRRDNGQSSKIASAATRAARPSSRPASAGGTTRTTRSSLTTAEDQRSFTASSLPSNTQNCSSG